MERITSSYYLMFDGLVNLKKTVNITGCLALKLFQMVFFPFCENHFDSLKQGQYLVFIDYYTIINGQLPVENDIQKYFKVSPPSVYRMIIKLAKNLIECENKKARSISRVRLNIEQLSQLI